MKSISGTTSGMDTVTLSNAVGVNINSCSGGNYVLNPQCILVKIEGFATTLTEEFIDNGTEALSMRTNIHDFHSYDIIIYIEE